MYAAPLQKQQQVLWSELESQVQEQELQSAHLPRTESFFFGEVGTFGT
jgi:hypothetical protein